MFHRLLLGIVILLVSISSFSNENMRIVFLDVHQGDAIFVFGPSGKVFLIDAGDRKVRTPSNGEENTTISPAYDVILPFMKKEGITQIDGIIVSHAHADHIGGMASVIKNTESVGTLYNSYNHTTQTFKYLVQLAEEREIPIKPLYRGDKLEIGGGAYFDILNPTEEMVKSFANDEERSNLNNLSIIIKAVYKNKSYLLTGDAETEAEEEMIYHGLSMKADFLKAAHHGSKTSSSPSFLSAVNPSYALVSVGKINQFRHPDYKFTLPNIKHYINVNKGAFFQTDLMGTVDTWTNGEEIGFITEKNPFHIYIKPEICESAYNFATIRTECSLDSLLSVELMNSDGRIIETYNTLSPARKLKITLEPLKPETEYQASIKLSSIEGNFSFESSMKFSTPAKAEDSQKFKTHFSKKSLYLNESIEIDNHFPKETIGGTLKIYLGSIHTENLIHTASITGTKGTASITTNVPGEQKIYFVVEKNGIVLSMTSSEIRGEMKIAGIDAVHGSTYLEKGELGNLIFLLEKRGYQIQLLKEEFSDETLSKLDLLIIPSIPKHDFGGIELNEKELDALHTFIEKGNNLFICGENDYSASIDYLNNICEHLELSIHFNDDEVRSGENGYRTLFLQNTSKEIVPETIENIVIKDSCSLISSKKETLLEDSTVKKLLCGNETCYNEDSDNESDKIQLMGNSLCIIASEDLPYGGRVVLCGSVKLLTNVSFNHNSKHQTEDFVLWLPQYITSSMSFTQTPMAFLAQIFKLKKQEKFFKEKKAALLSRWEEFLNRINPENKLFEMGEEFYELYKSSSLEQQQTLDKFRLRIIESLQNQKINLENENPELEKALLKLRLLD